MENIMKKLFLYWKKSGYKLAFTFHYTIKEDSYATRENNKYKIPRINLNGLSNIDDLKQCLNY